MRVLLIALCVSFAVMQAAPLIYTHTTAEYSVSAWTGHGESEVLLLYRTGSFTHPTDLSFRFVFTIPGAPDAEVYGRAITEIEGGRVLADATGAANGPDYYTNPSDAELVYRSRALTSVGAEARLEDELTVYGTGAGARMVVAYSLRRGRSFMGLHGGTAELTFGSLHEEPWWASHEEQISNEAIIPFVAGRAIPVKLRATGSGAGYSYEPWWNVTYSFGIVSIDSIRVIDALGAEVQGYRYGSATGLPYAFVGGTQIPEPATFLQLGAGALVLGLLRRRRP